MEYDVRRAGLADDFQRRTRLLHVQAERSGIISDILKGRASRFGYALLLRNLQPAYGQLEAGLERHRETCALGGIARPEVYRSGALAEDLVRLCGEDGAREIPLLPAGERYGRRIAEAADHDGAKLVAHAYARYIGDLSGGQILKRLLTRSLQLKPDSLSFYEFPQIADIKAFKIAYREAIDRSAGAIDDLESVVDEAVIAFELNIAVSEAVCQAAVRPHQLTAVTPGR